MRLHITTLLFALHLGSITPAYAGFEEGLDAVRAGDRATAFREFREAAEAGDSRAFGKLGASYLYGAGTEKDILQAFAWFRLALNDGDKEAERFLDAAAAELTPAQLEEAEGMATELINRYKASPSQEESKVNQ